MVSFSLVSSLSLSDHQIKIKKTMGYKYRYQGMDALVPSLAPFVWGSQPWGGDCAGNAEPTRTGRVIGSSLLSLSRERLENGPCAGMMHCSKGGNPGIHTARTEAPLRAWTGGVRHTVFATVLFLAVVANSRCLLFREKQCNAVALKCSMSPKKQLRDT